MPNWCYTQYRLRADRKTLGRIERTIRTNERPHLHLKKQDYEEVGAWLRRLWKGRKRTLENLPVVIAKMTGLKRDWAGDCWLCDILRSLGYSWAIINERRNARGYVTDFRREEDETLCIDCETAWSEADYFRELMEKKFPDLSMEYTAEEPGCGYYYTNIPDLEEDWVLDTMDVDGLEPGHYSMGDLLACLGQFLGKELTEETVGNAVAEYNDSREKKGEDGRIWINQLQYCED